MLRLPIKAIIAMVIALSLFPQFSDAFKEEQQGIEAARKKVVTAYTETKSAYKEARKYIDQVQKGLAEAKQDIDKGIEYANDKGAEATEYYRELKALAEQARDLIGAAPDEAIGDSREKSAQ